MNYSACCTWNVVADILSGVDFGLLIAIIVYLGVERAALRKTIKRMDTLADRWVRQQLPKE